MTGNRARRRGDLKESLMSIGGEAKKGLYKMYHRFNIFPEYVQKETDKHAVHGCRQTAIFGCVVLVLLVSLVVYYGLQEHAVAKVLENGSVQEVTNLFSQGYQPYCECSSPLIQFRRVASVNFTFDTLCEEIEQVWPIVERAPTTFWDGATFKGVLQGLFMVCNTIDDIRSGVYLRWQESYFTSVNLYSPSQLREIIDPQGALLQNEVADSIASSFKLSETFNQINAPAGYTTDAQPFPSPYSDSWGHHPNISSVHDFTVLSLSKISERYKNHSIDYNRDCSYSSFYSTSGVTDLDLQCYFHFWEGKACQNAFDIMARIISDGALLGSTSTTSGNPYDFDLNYYCSATQTLKNFPTKGLASEDFWAWSTFANDSFGGRMNQSRFQNISQALDNAFITSATTTLDYDQYFKDCGTKKCSYIRQEMLSSGAVVILVFGLMGGFISSLQILVPVIMAPCAPDDDDDDDDDDVGGNKKREVPSRVPNPNKVENQGDDVELPHMMNGGLEKKLTKAGGGLRMAQLEDEVKELRRIVQAVRCEKNVRERKGAINVPGSTTSGIGNSLNNSSRNTPRNDDSSSTTIIQVNTCISQQ